MCYEHNMYVRLDSYTYTNPFSQNGIVCPFQGRGLIQQRTTTTLVVQRVCVTAVYDVLGSIPGSGQKSVIEILSFKNFVSRARSLAVNGVKPAPALSPDLSVSRPIGQ